VFNLITLQQERAHKAILAKDIVDRAEKEPTGPRPMNADELDLFDKLTNEIKALDAKIADIEAHEKRREESAALVAKLEEPAGRQTTPGTPAATNHAASGAFKIPATARRAGSLKAFKGPDAEYRAYKAGLWARAVLFNDQRAAHKCGNHGILIQNAMGTNSNPDGGYLVPDELSQAIIDLREVYGVFRRECRVWPMGGDTLMIPRRTGGITIGLVGENPSSAISQSTPTFDQVQLVAKKFGGLSLLSSEIAEDAVIDLADWIANEFAYAFANFEDTAGFTGDGTSTYGGIRGLTNLFAEANGLAGSVLATAGDDTFAEVIAEDVSSLMGKLPAYARPNAKFYCSATCADIVFGRIAALAGGNTTQTLRDGLGLSYLGYPIVISQALPSSTSQLTDGSVMFLFGDLSKSSALGDRRMVKVFPSEHRYMDTDQIGIRGLERIDIVNHDVGTTSAAGPIVALLANAS
jgi:HK97 family phage major capsid protein